MKMIGISNEYITLSEYLNITSVDSLMKLEPVELARERNMIRHYRFHLSEVLAIHRLDDDSKTKQHLSFLLGYLSTLLTFIDHHGRIDKNKRR